MSESEDHKPRKRREARPQQALVNLQQVASVYGLPPSSVRDLVAIGALPAVRLPGSRRIWLRRVDLDLLVERSTVLGGA